MTAAITDDPTQIFIKRWTNSASAERANYQLFLSELCDLIGVSRPEPQRPEETDNAYVFEKSVTFDHADGTRSTGRIDLYKRGCFVLEAKQGSDAVADAAPVLFADPIAGSSRGRRGTAVRGTAGWDAAMVKARNQADRYVHALPTGESNPPFILVVDVGHVIEVYSEFTRLGRTYTPFPDAQSHRIYMADLADPKIREHLASIWTEPISLDPSRRAAKVTREIAARLAELAKRLESSGHDAHSVSEFLMRCLFTLFAEDAGLIKDEKFTLLLANLKGKAEQFPDYVRAVWKDMDKGDFSIALQQKLTQFNGGLFEDAKALPLTEDQLELLHDAATKDWADVEPAIFGTLLERALDTRERHKLGAHYTPRAYVERLVLPTVIEPLREQWDAAKAAAFTLAFQGKPAEAREEMHKFLRELCKVHVLDPACGSGNFLYVTMEHMKRLEGEVRDQLNQMGEEQLPLELTGLTVDPQQFLGLEINPRAVAIADLVLWIGYLKWHLKSTGHAPEPPILKKYDNIKEQDAVLAYDTKELATDESGKPVTRWDGHTMKISPVTGEEIPDESARVPVYKYINPRKAEWPKADYVIGNPPFIGNKRMLSALGEGYVSALRKAHEDVPDSVDFVMYWWSEAARQVAQRAIRAFGLITTNSITQTYNRQVVQAALDIKQKLRFAVCEHPWVDSADGAAVRIAMTVLAADQKLGRLLVISGEKTEQDGTVDISTVEQNGDINADLTVGLTAGVMNSLKANDGIVSQGVIPIGDGFKLDPDGLGHLGFQASSLPPVIKPYIIGMDLVRRPKQKWLIDFYGFTEADARDQYPQLYQHIYHTVRPIRLQNREPSRREAWWLFARSNDDLRRSIAGLSRYIAVPDTSKHKPFTFVQGATLPDAQVYCIATSDAWILGVLSSNMHQAWLRTVSPVLEDRPRWKPSVCYYAFPFPGCNDTQLTSLRKLAESLDAHRKRQQAAYSELTLTDMYNVLEKLRKNEPLTAKDKAIHEKGLVSVLKQIHDDLDAAVAEAYGWPVDLSDEEILRRLVALNAERAEEEKRGIIRWLRPEFQNPGGSTAAQGTLGLAKTEAKVKTAKAKKPAWPKELAAQIAGVRAVLQSAGKAISAKELAKSFSGAKEAKVVELLSALAALGQARTLEESKYAA